MEILIRLDDEKVIDELKRQAERNRRSMSDEIGVLVEQTVNQHVHMDRVMQQALERQQRGALPIV